MGPECAALCSRQPRSSHLAWIARRPADPPDCAWPSIPFDNAVLVRALDRHRTAGPIGRVGTAGDNAAMESFFSLLQKDVLDRRSWATRQELRIAIVTWIEKTYHQRHRQASLGRPPPAEYETVMTTPALQAA
ncbi:integrase core domain-containing protein [Streptomyces sp. NPDC055144]